MPITTKYYPVSEIDRKIAEEAYNGLGYDASSCLFSLEHVLIVASKASALRHGYDNGDWKLPDDPLLIRAREAYIKSFMLEEWVAKQVREGRYDHWQAVKSVYEALCDYKESLET